MNKISLLLAFTATSSAPQLKVSKRLLTNAEFSHLKKITGVYEKGKNYNIVIDGHGTGLIPRIGAGSNTVSDGV
jgi:hypothetical protein